MRLRGAVFFLFFILKKSVNIFQHVNVFFAINHQSVPVLEVCPGISFQNYCYPVILIVYFYCIGIPTLE
jgi:hypothetical protein